MNTTATLTPQVGDKIVFERSDGALCNDTIRCLFIQTALLEPYARNVQRPAAVLTEHSWCFLDDIRGFQPIQARPDYDANPKFAPAYRKVFYADSLGRIMRGNSCEVFRNRLEARVYWWMLARQGVLAFVDAGMDGATSNGHCRKENEPAELVTAIDWAEVEYTKH